MHKLALAAAAALLVAPSAALAASDHSVEVSEAQPTATWTGAPADSANALTVCPMPPAAPSVPTPPALPDAPDVVCDAHADTTLIKVDEPGTIVVTTAPDGPTTEDVDLTLYASDADGTRLGQIGDSAGGSANERTGAGVDEPGYYLAVVQYFVTAQGGYTGAVSFYPSSVEWVDGGPRHTVMNADAPTYEWDTVKGNGSGAFSCDSFAFNPCDSTLVYLSEPGDLSAEITTSETAVWDVLEIYQSNPAGTAEGEPLGESNVILPDAPDAPGGSTSTSATELEPGYYLIRMNWLIAAQDEGHGTATFTPYVPDEEEEL